MSRTLFANKPAPCREIDRIDRNLPHAAARDGARRLRDARGGHAPDADAGGWAGGDYARYARDSARYASAPAGASRVAASRARKRPRRGGASVIRPYAVMAGVLALVAVAVAVCVAAGRGGAGPAAASGPGAVAGATSTPVAEWRKGSVPQLYQTDPAWAGEPYAGSTVEEAGCGPTCLAMVYVCLTGKADFDPASLCAFSEREGYVSGGETSWLLMSEGARRLGLASEEVPADAAQVAAALEAGKPVICSVAPGDFTTTGHFIVLAGLNADGRLIVHDPNSAERTAQTWDMQTVLNQCRGIWAFSAA